MPTQQARNRPRGPYAGSGGRRLGRLGSRLQPYNPRDRLRDGDAGNVTERRRAGGAPPKTSPKMPSPREPEGPQGLGRRQSLRPPPTCQEGAG